MRDLLVGETSRRGAIFLEGDAHNIIPFTELLKDVFSFFATSHHISGRSICYPEHSFEVKNNEKSITHTRIYENEHIIKTVRLATELAKSGKHFLSVCLSPADEADSVLTTDVEIMLRKEKHLPTETITLEEMISLCLRTVPTFDVVLTFKESASLIAMHLNSMPKIPVGYIVNHGEKHNIYRRQILVHEEIGNLRHFSSLLSLAAIFENEFGMKNAAAWLRRALTLAFEKEANSSCEDFIKSIITEIETPIRKRRTE